MSGAPSSRRPRGLRLGMQAAGAVYFVLAGVCWSAYQKGAVIDVVPDGQWHAGPGLSASGRYDYQVVVTGTLDIPSPGITLDGRSAWNRQGERWHHGALELRPGALSPHPAGDEHRIVFTPDAGASTAGEPVAARLSLEQLQTDLYLPRQAGINRIDGHLQVEVRARDRYLQGGIAVALALAGMALVVAPLRKKRKS